MSDEQTFKNLPADLRQNLLGMVKTAQAIVIAHPHRDKLYEKPIHALTLLTQTMTMMELHDTAQPFLEHLTRMGDISATVGRGAQPLAQRLLTAQLGRTHTQLGCWDIDATPGIGPISAMLAKSELSARRQR